MKQRTKMRPSFSKEDKLHQEPSSEAVGLLAHHFCWISSLMYVSRCRLVKQWGPELSLYSTVGAPSALMTSATLHRSVAFFSQ